MNDNIWLNDDKLEIYNEILKGGTINIKDAWNIDVTFPDGEYIGIHEFSFNSIYINNKLVSEFTVDNIKSMEESYNYLFKKISNKLSLSFIEQMNDKPILSKNEYIQLYGIKNLHNKILTFISSMNIILNMEQIKILFPLRRPIIITKVDNVEYNDFKLLNETNFPNLSYLKFGENFNHPLDKSPTKIKKLTFLEFEDMFNQPLGHLKLGENLNYPLDKLSMKFNKLTYLEFGDIFNQPLGHSLDKLEKLTHLEFGKNFNQSLGN